MKPGIKGISSQRTHSAPSPDNTGQNNATRSDKDEPKRHIMGLEGECSDTHFLLIENVNTESAIGGTSVGNNSTSDFFYTYVGLVTSTL